MKRYLNVSVGCLEIIMCCFIINRLHTEQIVIGVL